MGPQPWGAVPVRQPALSGRGRRGLKPPSSEEIGDLDDLGAFYPQQDGLMGIDTEDQF